MKKATYPRLLGPDDGWVAGQGPLNRREIPILDIPQEARHAAGWRVRRAPLAPAVPVLQDDKLI